MATLSSRLTPLTVSVPAMSEPASYTPTGAVTTNATYTGRWRRVGDHLEGTVTVAFSGANTQGVLTFTDAQLLNGLGLSVDTSKIATSSEYQYAAGTWNATDSGVASRFSGLFARNQTGTWSLVFPTGSTTANIVDTSANTPFTIGANDSFSISFKVPISGWTSHTASATSANAVVVGGQSVGSKLNIGATSAQGVALLANNAAIVDSNSTGLIGLKFAPTASVSADVNTLDDYEEGTWTPSLVFAVPGTGQTYGSNRLGHYQKIGNRVYFHCYFVLASKGTGTGQVSITGLPFTPVAVASGGVSCVSVWSSGISITNNQLMGYVDAPNAQVQLNGTPINADAGAATACTNTHVLGTASLMLTGFYITAS